MTEHPLGYEPDDTTPEAPDTAMRGPGLPLSIDDILASARRVERVATICLRADLVAEYEDALAELAGLVNDKGELVVDPEATVGEKSAAARAQELDSHIGGLRTQMREAAWSVRFRAMDSDAWSVFTKQYLPKGDDADVTDFENRLVAAVAIEPTLTIRDVAKLRKALAPAQITKLVNTAWGACTTGGIDIPKSWSYSGAPKPQ